MRFYDIVFPIGESYSCACIALSRLARSLLIITSRGISGMIVTGAAPRRCCQRRSSGGTVLRCAAARGQAVNTGYKPPTIVRTSPRAAKRYCGRMTRLLPSEGSHRNVGLDRGIAMAFQKLPRRPAEKRVVVAENSAYGKQQLPESYKKKWRDSELDLFIGRSASKAMGRQSAAV